MLQKFLLISTLLDDPCVVHKPKPIPGGIRGRLEGFPVKMLHIQTGNYGADWWPHHHSLNLLIEFILKWEVCIMQTEPQKIYDVLYW